MAGRSQRHICEVQETNVIGAGVCPAYSEVTYPPNQPEPVAAAAAEAESKPKRRRKKVEVSDE